MKLIKHGAQLFGKVDTEFEHSGFYESSIVEYLEKSSVIVPEFKKKMLGKKVRWLSDEGAFLIWTLKNSFGESTLEELPHEDCLMMVATETTGASDYIDFYRSCLDSGHRMLNPMQGPNTSSNAAAANASIFLGLDFEFNTVCSGLNSFPDALHLAWASSLSGHGPEFHIVTAVEKECSGDASFSKSGASAFLFKKSGIQIKNRDLTIHTCDQTNISAESLLDMPMIESKLDQCGVTEGVVISDNDAFVSDMVGRFQGRIQLNDMSRLLRSLGGMTPSIIFDYVLWYALNQKIDGQGNLAIIYVLEEKLTVVTLVSGCGYQ